MIFIWLCSRRYLSLPTSQCSAARRAMWDVWRCFSLDFFFIFRNSFLYKITVSFTMVIKRSPGGESAGGGRSTLKSTRVVPAWTLTAFSGHSRTEHTGHTARLASKLARLATSTTGHKCARLDFWVAHPEISGCSPHTAHFSSNFPASYFPAVFNCVQAAWS